MHLSLSCSSDEGQVAAFPASVGGSGRVVLPQLEEPQAQEAGCIQACLYPTAAFYIPEHLQSRCSPLATQGSEKRLQNPGVSWEGERVSAALLFASDSLSPLA